MHTTVITFSPNFDETREYRVIHNGDWSGNISIYVREDDCAKVIGGRPDEIGRMIRVELPFELLKELVGRYINQQAIARMEQRSGAEIVDEAGE